MVKMYEKCQVSQSNNLRLDARLIAPIPQKPANVPQLPLEVIGLVAEQLSTLGYYGTLANLNITCRHVRLETARLVEEGRRQEDRFGRDEWLDLDVLAGTVFGAVQSPVRRGEVLQVYQVSVGEQLATGGVLIFACAGMLSTKTVSFEATLAKLNRPPRHSLSTPSDARQ